MRSPYLTAAAEAHPADADVHQRMADVYGLLGRNTEAEREKAEAERLDRALHQHPHTFQIPVRGKPGPQMKRSPLTVGRDDLTTFFFP